MVPRMRTVSSAADAGEAMQIRARLRAARVRCVVPDIVNPPWIFELTADSFVIPSAAYLFHRRPISQMLVEEAGDFLKGLLGLGRSVRRCPHRVSPSSSLFLDASKSSAAGCALRTLLCNTRAPRIFLQAGNKLSTAADRNSYSTLIPASWITLRQRSSSPRTYRSSSCGGRATMTRPSFTLSFLKASD